MALLSGGATIVTFHERAYRAAAEEYGRRRAERYGKVAKALAALGWLVGIVLAIGIVVAAHGGFGG